MAGLAAIAPSPTPGVALGAAEVRRRLVAERPLVPTRKAGRGWAALLISGLLHGAALAAVVTEMARPQPGLVTGTVQVTLISRLPPDPTPAALSHPVAPPSLAAPPQQPAPDAPTPDRPRLSPPQALPAAPLARLTAPASETAPEPMDLPPPAPPPATKAAPEAQRQPLAKPQIEPQTQPMPARTAPKAPPVEHLPPPRKAAPPPAARAASGGAPSRAGQAGTEGPSQAQMSLMAGWARALVGRIEQHKRYPVAAGDARGVVT
ncbi:MAG: hypothetical protein KGK00_01945, partial [Paracoccaceae bacterium]|nr:hypothetical protein [Paracoccaceae bacterium]